MNRTLKIVNNFIQALDEYDAEPELLANTVNNMMAEEIARCFYWSADRNVPIDSVRADCIVYLVKRKLFTEKQIISAIDKAEKDYEKF